MRIGLEVLAARDFAPLRGRRVGLITNHTGLTPEGERTADLLARVPGIKLAALFCPQHGPEGRFEDGDFVASGADAATGAPVYSLFDRDVLRPTPEMLRDLDVLVFDIQDIGARFYTYITTLGYALEEAARAGLPFVVLDRPNPINGRQVEGPLLQPEYFSFIGYFSLPVRHGMTVGELARLFNAEKRIGADLRVVEMEGWRRSDWYDHTGLPWINPSPNMRSLTTATLYPGSCLLEGAKNFSVGRGTDTPFQVIGAPWLEARRMTGFLNERSIPGMRFLPRRFTPAWSNCAGQQCRGLEMLVLDREALAPVHMGIEIIAAILKMHPGRLNLDDLMSLLGHAATAALLRQGEDPRRIVAGWQEDLDAFLEMRKQHLIYS